MSCKIKEFREKINIKINGLSAKEQTKYTSLLGKLEALTNPKEEKGQTKLEEIVNLSEKDFNKKYPNINISSGYTVKSSSKVTKSKPTIRASLAAKLKSGHTISTKSLATLSQEDQYDTLTEALSTFSTNKITNVNLSNSIRNSTLPDRVRDVLLHDLASKPTELGAIKSGENIIIEDSTQDYNYKDDTGEKINRGVRH